MFWKQIEIEPSDDNEEEQIRMFPLVKAGMGYAAQKIRKTAKNDSRGTMEVIVPRESFRTIPYFANS